MPNIVQWFPTTSSHVEQPPPVFQAIYVHSPSAWEMSGAIVRGYKGL